MRRAARPPVSPPPARVPVPRPLGLETGAEPPAAGKKKRQTKVAS